MARGQGADIVGRNPRSGFRRMPGRCRNCSVCTCGRNAFGGSALRLLFVLLAACLPACAAGTGATGCTIEGPEPLLPETVRRAELGMTMAQLEAVLGSPDYSPAEGQFYFGTGGDCPLDDADRMAACGVVAEFRSKDDAGDAVVSGSLQSCWWGAIGE